MGETADWLYNQRQNNLSFMREIVDVLEAKIFAKYEIEADDIEQVYDAIANVGEAHSNLEEAYENLSDEYSMEVTKNNSDLKEMEQKKDILKKTLFGIS